MQLHSKQQIIARSNAQFKPIRAGRKGGKTAFEVENIALKESNTQYKLLTDNLFTENDLLKRTLLLTTTQRDSLQTVVFNIPDAPKNPDKILWIIPKPTRTQTYILGIATGIVANIVINRQIHD